jgi:hypothetical protein
MPDHTLKPDEPTRKSVSEKQLAANRANAAKSTGPTSPDGLARSAQNSRKHGFTATKFVVSGVEEAQDLENLKADIIETYRPVNRLELLTCERIATAVFVMQRSAQLEAGLLTSYFNNSLHSVDNLMDELAEDMDIQTDHHQHLTFYLGKGFHYECKVKQKQSFALFLRYKTQAERDYRRAVEEFERLRQLRDEFAGFPNEPVLDNESERSEDLSPVPDSPNEPISADPSRKAASGPQSPIPNPQSLAPKSIPSREAACNSQSPIPDAHLAPAPGSGPLAPPPATDPRCLIPDPHLVQSPAPTPATGPRSPTPIFPPLACNK